MNTTTAIQLKTETGTLSSLLPKLQYPLPHHLISRVVYFMTRLSTPFTPTVIKWFIRQYKVDMSEALEPDITTYKTFNAFFTRALKEEARPQPTQANTLASPADGRISAFGDIRQGLLIQAKQHDYSVESLLADPEASRRFSKGSFVTVYLSPRDYHRIHMSDSGSLLSMTHVPGRLFSVAPSSVDTIPSLFARNERVVSLFETAHGAMAMVLVGAMNVAAIETVWAGQVTPFGNTSRRQPSHWHYGAAGQQHEFNQGDEMGRFNMGSTVIVLTETPLDFESGLTGQSPVKMGMSLAHYRSS